MDTAALIVAVVALLVAMAAAKFTRDQARFTRDQVAVGERNNALNEHANKIANKALDLAETTAKRDAEKFRLRWSLYKNEETQQYNIFSLGPGTLRNVRLDVRQRSYEYNGEVYVTTGDADDDGWTWPETLMKDAYPDYDVPRSTVKTGDVLTYPLRSPIGSTRPNHPVGVRCIIEGTTPAGNDYYFDTGWFEPHKVDDRRMVRFG